MADNQHDSRPTPQVRDLPRQGPKVYRGKPENQRDPNASHQPFKKAPSSRRAPPKRDMPSELPPPSQKAQNVGGKISTTSPADATLFAEGMSVREVQPRTTFTPSAPALAEIANQMYAELITDDSSLGKIILPEYISYYSTAMFWLRVITLKERNSQELTVAEEQLLTMVQTTSFVLPEPLLLQIRAVGNLVTSTKQHLFPSFPPMPQVLIQQLGGFFGILVAPAENTDDSIHNLYEELPCLGVMANAVMQAVSGAAPGPYVPRVTYQGQVPTRNLIGFRPLGHRRPEAKNLASDNGITDAEFQSYPRNLAFNLDFLMAISNILANSKTFKNTPVVFSTLSEVGAQSQIIIERPVLVPGELTPAVRGEIQPLCLIKEPEAVFGSGIFFCQQLRKETPNDDNSSWALFDNIPPEWEENKNDRRNLPFAYSADTFQAISQMASAFRMNIIKGLVTTKRA